MGRAALGVLGVLSCVLASCTPAGCIVSDAVFNVRAGTKAMFCCYPSAPCADHRVAERPAARLSHSQLVPALRILAKWSDEIQTSLLERPGRLMRSIREADPSLGELERLEQLIQNAGILLADLEAIAGDVADRLELEQLVERLEPAIAVEQRERLEGLRAYLAAESLELEQLERVAGVHSVLVLLAFRALAAAGLEPVDVAELVARMRPTTGDEQLAGDRGDLGRRQQEL